MISKMREYRVVGGDSDIGKMILPILHKISSDWILTAYLLFRSTEILESE